MHYTSEWGPQFQGTPPSDTITHNKTRPAAGAAAQTSRSRADPKSLKKTRGDLRNNRKLAWIGFYVHVCVCLCLCACVRACCMFVTVCLHACDCMCSCVSWVRVGSFIFCCVKGHKHVRKWMDKCRVWQTSFFLPASEFGCVESARSVRVTDCALRLFTSKPSSICAKLGTVLGALPWENKHTQKQIQRLAWECNGTYKHTQIYRKWHGTYTHIRKLTKMTWHIRTNANVNISKKNVVMVSRIFFKAKSKIYTKVINRESVTVPFFKQIQTQKIFPRETTYSRNFTYPKQRHFAAAAERSHDVRRQQPPQRRWA